MKPPRQEGAFDGARRTPWGGQRGLESVLASWRADKQVRPCIALDEVTPAREGEYAPIPESLAPSVRAALQQRGIQQLFSHQAEAFHLATQGQSLVIATPTASGKSLCYNLLVLDRFAREEQARALLRRTRPCAHGLRQSMTGSGRNEASINRTLVVVRDDQVVDLVTPENIVEMLTMDRALRALRGHPR